MKQTWFMLAIAACAHPGRKTGDADVARATEQAFERRCEPDEPPGARALTSFQDASELYGYRDAAGNVVIAPRFPSADEFHGEVAGVIDHDRAAFIDTSGRVVARAHLFENGPDSFVAGRARIIEQGKMGFIDTTGRVAVKPQFDFAFRFCEARAAVCVGCWFEPEGEHHRVVGGRWGYIDRDGRIVIPLEFDEASTFENGVAEVVKGGRRIRIDRDGREVRRAP